MRVHFIAIGGSAMHNLAIELKKNGYTVTGSDDEIFEPSKSKLAKYGLLPASEGWDEQRITEDLKAVIVGMHARADNPELLKAQQLGLPIFSYPEYIFEQSKNKFRVVIGGSHGKTSTTAIILHVLKHAGFDFDFLVGASLPGFDLTVKITEKAPIMIIEGDEYLSSPIDPRPKFHLYHPQLALLTGVAWDHINVFPTFDSYKQQFSLFLESMIKDGTVIYCEEDANLVDIIQRDHSPLLKMGYNVPAHFIREGITYLKTPEGKAVDLKVFGHHNMLNIGGALAICRQLGVPENIFYEAIKTFQGATRRLELIAENDHTRIFWDFAHAPSKLKATVLSVKEQFPDKTLVACMELHTFSSLNEIFLQQYAGSMEVADEAIVYFNLHTLEHKKLTGLTVDQVKRAFGRQDLHVFTDSKQLQGHLRKMELKGKVLLLMSSGNFDGINIKEFAQELI